MAIVVLSALGLPVKVPSYPRPDGIFSDPAPPWRGRGAFQPTLSTKLLEGFSIRKRHSIAPSFDLLNVLKKNMKVTVGI